MSSTSMPAGWNKTHEDLMAEMKGGKRSSIGRPQSHEREREPVQLAIVELCAGSEEKLLELVQTAKTDYRDILAWQELGPLSKAKGKKVQDGARDQLEKWGKK